MRSHLEFEGDALHSHGKAKGVHVSNPGRAAREGQLQQEFVQVAEQASGAQCPSRLQLLAALLALLRTLICATSGGEPRALHI